MGLRIDGKGFDEFEKLVGKYLKRCQETELSRSSKKVLTLLLMMSGCFQVRGP